MLNLPDPAPQNRVDLRAHGAPQIVQACSIRMAHELPDDMQRVIAHNVSNLTQSYAKAGDFVLPQTPERIQAAIKEKRLFVALNEAQTEFVGAAKWVPLLVSPGGSLQVAEIGSLVRAPNARGYGVPTPVALCVSAIVKELESRGALGVATARSEKSRICLAQGGMIEVRWELLPAIAALTCDPGCAKNQAGEPAWIECGTDISCGARPGVESSRSDTCALFVSNPERALALNTELAGRADSLESGCFSARRFRAAIGLRV